MKSVIEDKIIAYFDGELSDADSAELLHLVSISPEIRDLFRQHEMLRELAHEATRSVMVSPEVESALFSRIEALAQKPAREKAVLIFSRRTVAVAALALVLISSSLGYLVPKLFSNGPEEQVQAPALRQENISGSEKTLLNGSSAASIEKLSLPVKANLANVVRKQVALNREVSDREEIGSVTDRTDGTGRTDVAKISLVDKPIGLREINPVSAKSEDIHSSNIGEHHSPFDLKEISPESGSLFEIGLQTSSGFTYPADAAPIKPFADQRLSIAYHITENNVIGFRLGSGLYQQLGDVKRTQENGLDVLSRNIETKRSFSEEIYFSHLEPIYFVAPLTLEFSLGGGFIPNGYSLGIEAGIRIPLSESFLFDAVFALSRIHSNGLAASAILASESTSNKPVLFGESTDIRNTLNGRLHYGFIYRF